MKGSFSWCGCMGLNLMQTSNNIRDTWLWRDHERGGSWLKKEKKEREKIWEPLKNTFVELCPCDACLLLISCMIGRLISQVFCFKCWRCQIFSKRVMLGSFISGSCVSRSRWGPSWTMKLIDIPCPKLNFHTF